MIEIERKFLVVSDHFKEEAESEIKIKQGFLNTHPDRTVRVRVFDDEAKLTVKGRTTDSGTTRREWEISIPVKDAEMLLELCEETLVEKTRYLVRKGHHVIEIDEFEGENAGLVIAEIELSNEDEEFERPYWLGEEVTGELKYYNSMLSRRPYSTW